MEHATAKASIGLAVVLAVVVLGEAVAVLANTSSFSPGFVLAGLFIVMGIVIVEEW